MIGVDKVFMGIFVSLGFKMLEYNSYNLKYQQGKNVTIDEALDKKCNLHFHLTM